MAVCITEPGVDWRKALNQILTYVRNVSCTCHNKGYKLGVSPDPVEGKNKILLYSNPDPCEVWNLYQAILSVFEHDERLLGITYQELNDDKGNYFYLELIY